MAHLFRSADISTFSTEISKFCYIKNTFIDCILIHNFYFSLTILEYLKIHLIKMVTVLMMSVKMTMLNLLEIKVFLSKGDDIIYVNDVTNKILSRDSNYIANVVMWLNFGNSSISLREVIITTSLKGLDQKNHFFLRVGLVSSSKTWTQFICKYHGMF